MLLKCKENGVREEVVELVSKYFKSKLLSKDEIKCRQEFISNVLRNREKFLTGKDISPTFRDYEGIHLQTHRIRCLDPDTDYCGMQGTKLQKQVLKEYFINPDKINSEADKIIEKYSYL